MARIGTEDLALVKRLLPGGARISAPMGIALERVVELPFSLYSALPRALLLGAVGLGAQGGAGPREVAGSSASARASAARLRASWALLWGLIVHIPYWSRRACSAPDSRISSALRSEHV